jgi:hypothetical protein
VQTVEQRKHTHTKAKHGKVYHLDNNHSNKSNNNNNNNKFDSIFIYALDSNSQRPITERKKQKSEI